MSGVLDFRAGSWIERHTRISSGGSPVIGGGASSPLQLFRRPDFLRLWACGTLAGSMRWFEILSVGVYTLEQTHSALLVALMLFARTVPLFLVGSFIGVVAERLDRRKMLFVGMLGAATTATVLAVLSFLEVLALWHVAVGASINGVLWTMEHPVRRALLSDAVGRESVAQAISLDAASTNGTRMLGPMAGGLLYAVLGLQGAYVIGAVAYSIAAILVYSVVPVVATRRAASEGFWRSLSLGIRYVSSHEVLSAVMVLTIVANTFGFSYIAMVPVLGERILNLDAPGIGLLMFTEGLGATLGALMLAFVIRPRAYTQVFTFGAIVFLTMVLILSRAESMLLAMATLFVAGFGLAGFASMQSTILLAGSERELRSRVMGVLAVCIGTGPLGILLVGWLAERFGAPLALSMTSTCGLFMTLVLCIRRPRLVRAFGVNLTDSFAVKKDEKK